MLEVCRGWVGDDLSIPVKMTNLTINPIVSYCYGSSYKKFGSALKILTFIQLIGVLFLNQRAST